jgi:hypothetical protein
MTKYEQVLSTASEAPLLGLRQFSGFERRYSLTDTNHFKISSLSARDIERLFALMSGYRLIDSFHMSQSDVLRIDAPTHRKQSFIGDWENLASKGWGHLNDWVQLTLDFVQGLHTWDMSLPNQSNATSRSDVHQLKLASALLNKSTTATILLNFHLAAMHVSHLFSSPSDSEVSRSLLFLLCC